VQAISGPVAVGELDPPILRNQRVGFELWELVKLFLKLKAEKQQLEKCLLGKQTTSWERKVSWLGSDP
jgi:hypothetical protein